MSYAPLYRVVFVVVVIVNQCDEDACKNGATCVSQLNGVVCNCDLTSFTGPTCSAGSSVNTAFTVSGGSVVERRSLTSELSLVCTGPAADG